MTLRDETIRANPDFPWLEADDSAGVQSFLRERGWIDKHESVTACAPAGAGNMNLTLRVETPERQFILKQARPWVEKYPDIPAPWDRGLSEALFYERVRTIAPVATRMPAMLAHDPASRALVLEYLPGPGDFSDLYEGQTSTRLSESDLETAADYLASLHSATRGKPQTSLANREMRALNHAHIFEIPFAPESGVDLEALESGLTAKASDIQADTELCEIAGTLGTGYLEDGPCLLHGDYFPGSWLRTSNGLFVIDPEFCFFGPPEIDLGCAIAHFALSHANAETPSRFLRHYAAGLEAESRTLDELLLGRFAAIEVIRRLIGVAQLPIPIATTFADGNARGRFRTSLLDRARVALRAADWHALFE